MIHKHTIRRRYDAQNPSFQHLRKLVLSDNRNHVSRAPHSKYSLILKTNPYLGQVTLRFSNQEVIRATFMRIRVPFASLFSLSRDTVVAIRYTLLVMASYNSPFFGQR